MYTCLNQIEEGNSMRKKWNQTIVNSFCLQVTINWLQQRGRSSGVISVKSQPQSYVQNTS